MIVDALLVSGDSIGREATIGLSCEGTLPAVLIGQNDTPIRAWKVSPVSLSLTEVDPGDLTTAELESACLNRN